MSLDSGVNINDQDLSMSPVLSSPPPLSSHNLEDVLSDSLQDSEDEFDSDVSEPEFVSYQFDDYPDTVYDTQVDTNLAKEIREKPRRKSSIVNPAELYCSADKMCDCGNLCGEQECGRFGHIQLRRSQSIKSRL